MIAWGEENNNDGCDAGETRIGSLLLGEEMPLLIRFNQGASGKGGMIEG